MDDYRISKPNRNRTQEQKRHAIVQGSMPPSGIHKESRKERDRRRAIALKAAMRG